MKTLLIGEEHVRAKAARHARFMEDEKGIRTHFFVDDRSGITRQVLEQHPVEVRFTANPRGGAGALLTYWRDFRRYFEEVKPDLLEIYPAVNPVVLIPMVAYARMRGVPVVAVCRGELYPTMFYANPRVVQRLMIRMLRMADLIVYKDTYSKRVLDVECPRTPTMSWYNAIPVRGEPSYAREGNHLLFLNSFNRVRNIEVIVRSARRVRQAVPDVQFHLVGGAEGGLSDASPFFLSLHAYEREIAELIQAEGVGDFVHIHPFTTQVEPWFARARAYLFPADHVFANYGLLEAMERGVPPIVSDQKDRDARLIVEHGVNGVIVPIDPDALADGVVHLLADEGRRREMARQARATVTEKYNLGRAMHSLADAYQELVARRRRGRGAASPLRAAASRGGD